MASFSWYDSEVICPITLLPIEELACTDTGSVYEAFAIREWLTTHNTDPATGIELPCRHIWYLGELRNGPSRAVTLIKAQALSEELRRLPLQCRYRCSHNCQTVTY